MSTRLHRQRVAGLGLLCLVRALGARMGGEDKQGWRQVGVCVGKRDGTQGSGMSIGVDNGGWRAWPPVLLQVVEVRVTNESKGRVCVQV